MQIILRFCPCHFALINSGRDGSRQIGTNIKMSDLKVIRRIRQKYARLAGAMDRRLRRQWAALEAKDLGWGGVRKVSLATGLTRQTILAGTRELARRRTQRSEKRSTPSQCAGKGRKPLTQTDPGLHTAMDALMNPKPHPTGPLRWTCQSTAKFAQELQRQNHPVSDRTVASLLQEAGYRLQDIRKCNEGSSHADRDAQFAYINQQATAVHQHSEPVVWVITSKKEVKGQPMISRQKWQPSGTSHKFSGQKLSERTARQAPPHGVFDLPRDTSIVNMRIDGDTTRFAVACIGRWWQEMGVERFPDASRLLLVADVGGSNRARRDLWKVALQDLTNQLKLPLEICHFPPGTTKWHKIEHSLLSYITRDWRGQASVSYEVMVNLIARTTFSNHPIHWTSLDRNHRQNGNVVADAAVDQSKMVSAKIHGEWNYVMRPTL